jgi:hypothetical protein
MQKRRIGPPPRSIPAAVAAHGHPPPTPSAPAQFGDPATFAPSTLAAAFAPSGLGTSSAPTVDRAESQRGAGVESITPAIQLRDAWPSIPFDRSETCHPGRIATLPGDGCPSQQVRPREGRHRSGSPQNSSARRPGLSRPVKTDPLKKSRTRALPGSAEGESAICRGSCRV